MTNRERNLNINRNSLGNKYEFIPEKYESIPKNEVFSPIGEGGSGIVFAANQYFSKKKDIFIKRAIKFFMFRDDLVSKWGYVSADNFKTEITNITKFNHQNVLKVIDGDYYVINIDTEKVEIPYTITEFIGGQNLENLFDEKNSKLRQSILKNEETIFLLFLQIVSGIQYLHKNNFFHCDVAPKNIFLKTDAKNDDFLAVIGDFGAGRTKALKSFDTTKVIGTREYMPKNVVEMNNQTITYEQFCKIQPQWDLHSTVSTLKNIINNIKSSTLFKPDYWNLDRLYEKLNEYPYKDVAEILSDLERLRPSSNQIFKLDELSEASKNIGQTLLPINSVFFSRRMKKLSKHDTLLRLMDVPQLLEGATTFPGANHTRYEHSLGTYELMRKSMLALLRNKEYAKFLSEKYVITGLLSALFSSLVNFPYSYAISELQIQEKNIYTELLPRRIFQKLMNMKSEVTNKSLIECINELFSEYQINIHDLEYVIFGKLSDRVKELDVLHALLNSSVGVRVIDYLMRDSHHIGLTYKIDPNDLFKSLSISKGEFCLRQPGISSTEQIISNRYWLFKRIYWSDPNRANAALLKYMFFTVHSKTLTKQIFNSVHNLSKNNLLDLFLEYSGEYSKSIKYSVNFIKQKGQVRYKSILVLDKNSSHPHSNDTCSKFADLPYSKQYEIRNLIEKKFLKKYNISDTISDAGVPLLIDMPFEKTGNKLGNDIRVLRYDNSFLELNKASGIVSGLLSSFEDQLMLLRVYIRPDIYIKIIEDDRIGRNDIESFINQLLHDLL